VKHVKALGNARAPSTYIVSVVGPGPSLIRLMGCHPITANRLYSCWAESEFERKRITPHILGSSVDRGHTKISNTRYIDPCMGWTPSLVLQVRLCVEGGVVRASFSHGRPIASSVELGGNHNDFYGYVRRDHHFFRI
jgi:hypothetical protein